MSWLSRAKSTNGSRVRILSKPSLTRDVVMLLMRNVGLVKGSFEMLSEQSANVDTGVYAKSR